MNKKTQRSLSIHSNQISLLMQAMSSDNEDATRLLVERAMDVILANQILMIKSHPGQKQTITQL